jgi:hypothetical protein
MVLTRFQKSLGGQSSSEIACPRGATTRTLGSSPAPRQGNADVISTNVGLLAGGLDGVASGGQSATNYNPIFSQTNSAGQPIPLDVSSCDCGIINHPCNDKRCKNCVAYSSNHFFSSFVSGRTYHAKTSAGLSCTSSNVIYLLECEMCKSQYVGETGGACRDRMNGHRSGMRTKKDKILYDHFLDSPCTGYSFKVQILEKLDPIPGKTIKELTNIRQKKEDEWMSRLQTVFPYGLNDRCMGRDWGNRDDEDLVSRTCFSKLGKVLDFRHRSKKFSRTKSNPNVILADIHGACSHNAPDRISCVCILNYSRKIINSLKKSTGKALGNLITATILENNFHPKFLPQYYDAILDQLNSKFSPKKKGIQNNVKRKPGLLCKIHFRTKNIEDVNIPFIFRLADTVKAVPVLDEKPTILYIYNKPVHSKILNYKHAITNLNVDDFIESYNEITCDCHSSIYKDAFHGHIMTGNLDLVENQDLKFLLKQGPNFREEPSRTNFYKLFRDIKKDIIQSIETWAKKESLPVQAFDEWKVKVFEILHQRIKYISKNPRKTKMEVLKDENALTCLSNLHQKFVLTTVDKCNNNVAIICKKFYIKNILCEVGLWPGSTSDTYANSNLTKNIILKKQFLFNETNKISNNSRKSDLPFPFATLKCHKNPKKFRYIVSSSQSQTKPLAQVITKCLKLCQKQHKAYCKALQNYTGINRYWIIENNQPILDKIRKINESNVGAESVETFDFSTLYTKIEHESLKQSLGWFISTAFSGASSRGQNSISVYSWNAKWVKKPRGSTLSFDCCKLQKLIDFLIDNTFFNIGEKIIKQNIGLPMGTDPAPYMANAHLYFYEFKFQELQTKQNYSLAKSLNNTCRYIDDVTPLNDKGNFSRFKKDIYPPDLLLIKENEGIKDAAVLDIYLQISNGKFLSGVFDKTDRFNFSVNKYPSLLSNVPSKILYEVFYSQILRPLNICNNINAFIERICVIFVKCIRRGASPSKLFQKLRKYFRNNNFSKYNLSKNDLKTVIFDKLRSLSC